MNDDGELYGEFVTYFGYTILIIIVLVAISMYYGIFEPKSLIADSCELLEPGFVCNDWYVRESEAGLSIRNMQQGAVSFTKAFVAYDTSLWQCQVLDKGDISRGKAASFICPSRLDGMLDSKVKVYFTVYYTLSGNLLEQSFKVDVLTTVH